MDALRKSLLFVSVPLVLLVVVGTIRARVDESRDRVLRDLKVFSESLYLVDNYYVEDVPLAQLERGAFQGLAESLGPWSSYWDPTAMKALVERDETADIGVLLVKTPQQYVAVASVVPGSPADRAEVRLGQFIETIDGLATKDLTLIEAQHMLAGPPGTTVDVGYFRQSADADAGEHLTIVREDLRALSVVAEAPAEGVGLLRVTDLGPGTADRMRAELGRFQAAGVGELVLDLRANVGGSLEEALAVAGLFVEPRAVFGEKGRSGTRLLETTAQPVWKGSLVVLVSRGTVGEGELVARALKDAELGPLVGQPTFGKRTRQDTVRLRDGAGLRLTVAEYVGPTGESLDENGVAPTEVVAGAKVPLPHVGLDGDGLDELDESESPPAAAPPEASGAEGAEGGAPGDPQLDRALEILKGAPVRKAA